MHPALPAMIRHALELVRRDQPSAELEGWAICGAAIDAALHAAQPEGGPAVVATILALQTGLNTPHVANREEESGPAASCLPPRVQSALIPFFTWLEEHRGPTAAPGRAMLARWVDVLADRLTMARYGDPRKRLLQARVLLAEPLRLLAGEPGKPYAPGDPLDAFCACALTFWDVVHAREQAEHGWSRIEALQAGSMGGYYALGESPRAPDAAEIETAARALLERLAATPPPATQYGAWLEAMHAEMSGALTAFLETGAWPRWAREGEVTPGGGSSWLGRLRRMLGGASR